MSTNSARILITGDFCPINRTELLSQKGEYNLIYNDFIDVFQGNDLNITDLECPLTYSEKSRIKTGPHQKAHPDCINILAFANIGLAALANNHIMDYDNVGVQETIDACKVSNIDTLGLGKKRADAAKIYSTRINDISIGILNYADNEFISTSDGSFHCNPLNPEGCFYDITKARQNHDHLVVIIHAGNEFYELPSPRTKRLYRYIIDVGADAIISHHTHSFSGFEVYKNKPIFYGLGNFIYDWPGKINSRWNKGYVVRLIIADKIDFEIIPLKQNEEKPGVFHLNTLETEAFLRELNRLNQIISDDQLLESEFQKYCNSVFPMYDAFIEPSFGKYIAAIRKRGLFPKLMSRKKRLLLLNITRCESHRDVLLRLLKNYE